MLGAGFWESAGCQPFVSLRTRVWGFRAQGLQDEITLKSRALYPYTMSPYMVYEPQTLFLVLFVLKGFMVSATN